MENFVITHEVLEVCGLQTMHSCSSARAVSLSWPIHLILNSSNGLSTKVGVFDSEHVEHDVSCCGSQDAATAYGQEPGPSKQHSSCYVCLLGWRPFVNDSTSSVSSCGIATCQSPRHTSAKAARLSDFFFDIVLREG